MTPRLLRLRDAPNYLGMARSIFERDVRPYLTHIKIGVQGVAFDRHELDAYADYRVQKGTLPERDSEWQNVAQGFANEEMFGTSTNEYTVKLSGSLQGPGSFEKRKPISPIGSQRRADLEYMESERRLASARQQSAISKKTGT